MEQELQCILIPCNRMQIETRNTYKKSTDLGKRPVRIGVAPCCRLRHGIVSGRRLTEEAHVPFTIPQAHKRGKTESLLNRLKKVISDQLQCSVKEARKNATSRGLSLSILLLFQSEVRNLLFCLQLTNYRL